MSETENNQVEIVAQPHPLKDISAFYYVKEGDSIQDIINQIQPDEELSKYTNVWVNNQIILPGRYKDTFITKDDKMVVKTALTGGGDGKNILNTILTVVAVIAIAVFLPPALPAAWGTAAVATTVAVAQMAAVMVINAIVPPYSMDSATYDRETRYSLENNRNSIRQFESLHCVLGRHKVFADYAVTGYTETIGTDSYLRTVFNWGYGPLQVEDIEIDDTPIDDYTDVEYETRQMYDPEDPFSIYTIDAEEVYVQATLDEANISVIRTTAIATKEISWEITFPGGLHHVKPNSGDIGSETRVFSCEYRKNGTEEWEPLNPNIITVSSNTRTSFVKSYTHTFTEEAIYDIKITPLNTGWLDAYTITTAQWSILRSYSVSAPILKEGLTLTAVKIKATDQLNGAISGLTATVTTVCPDWDKDTQTWITRPTNNPASLYRYVLQGPFLNTPHDDDSIDLEHLAYWHEYCETQGFECNLVVTTALPLSEILGKIASTGRATNDWLYGKRTVIIDEPKKAKQVVTPRNSSGFNLTKVFTDVPHAWRIPFLNEEQEYLTDEYTVYADGYDHTNATIYETLSFEGVTKPSQIYKMGRYYHHVAKLRPETYSFVMDVENLVCRKGDVLIINHDVPAYGIKSARIKEVIYNNENQCESLVLDDFMIYEDDKTYYIRIRYSNGDIELFDINNKYTASDVNAEDYQVILKTPLTGLDIPEEGDLVMLGVTEVETAQVMIKSVTPGNDLSATIEAINYDENIYQVGEIPEFDSKITLSPDYYYGVPTGLPVTITSIKTDESAVIRTTDNSIIPGILLNYTVNSSKDIILSKFEIQWRLKDTTEWTPLTELPSTPLSYTIHDNIQEGEVYEIRIRSYASAYNYPGTVGPASEWSYITTEPVIGTTSVPPDIINMRIENRYITWEYPDKPIDFKGFEVRQIGGVTPVWDLATVVSSGLITNAEFNVSEKTYGQQVYMVKAVDRNNKYSTNYAYIISDFGPIAVNNVRDETRYQDDWLNMGTLEGGSLNLLDNTLISTSSGVFWEGKPPTGMFWSGKEGSFFWGGSYFDMYYTTNPYTIISDGRMTVQIDLTSIYGYFLQYREYKEGISPEEGWNNWTNYLEVKKGQQYQFKVSCYQGTTASVLKSLIVINDVEDQTEFFNDITIPVEGLRIPITKQYEIIKTVTYALQSDGNGGISILLEDKDPINGPLVKVLDNNNQSVTALIDVTVYGVPKT